MAYRVGSEKQYMSYSKKYTYNHPPIVYINDEMLLNISIYLYMYTYILRVCVVAQSAHKSCSLSLALPLQCQGHQVQSLMEQNKGHR